MTSVLKDGKQLAEYLLDLNVRVTTSATYELKQVDPDHFTEEYVPALEYLPASVSSPCNRD
jgi:hypothetical protein